MSFTFLTVLFCLSVDSDCIKFACVVLIRGNSAVFWLCITMTVLFMRVYWKNAHFSVKQSFFFSMFPDFFALKLQLSELRIFFAYRAEVVRYKKIIIRLNQINLPIFTEKKVSRCCNYYSFRAKNLETLKNDRFTLKFVFFDVSRYLALKLQFFVQFRAPINCNFRA